MGLLLVGSGESGVSEYAAEPPVQHTTIATDLSGFQVFRRRQAHIDMPAATIWSDDNSSSRVAGCVPA